MFKQLLKVGAKHHLVFSILFLAPVCLKAQGGARALSYNEPLVSLPVKALGIGDVVPDIEFEMVNYKASTAKLSDFRGKIVILDFWAIWCTGCIASFPKLDSLQKQFGDKLQIVLHNKFNSQNDIERFFNFRKNSRGEKYILPSVTNDTIANVLFKHKAIPNYVWIDGDGKVMAITGSEEVTTSNIEKVLNGEVVHFRLKDDFKENLNVRSGLAWSSADTNILFRSSLSTYANGMTPNWGRSKNEVNETYSRMFWTNFGIEQIYKDAFKAYLPKNQRLLEVKDPGKLRYTVSQWDAWKANNTFCFELIVKPISESQFYSTLQNELIKVFGYDAHFELRRMKCLILIRSSKDRISSALSSSDGPSESNLTEKTDQIKFIRNKYISAMVASFNELLPTPVFDETNYKGKISMVLTKDLSDVKRLNAELNKYGFELKEDVREMKVFVITDNQKNLKELTTISKR